MNEQVSLYFKQDGSDKVYMAQLECENENACVVNVQYGRRGSTLQSITKTASPIAYAKAKKTYDKLVSEKLAKGYTGGENGTPFQGTDKAGRVSGHLPQLLNPVSDSEAQALILDPGYVAQEKINGERRLLQRKSATEALGINRKGLVVDLPQPIATAALKDASGGLFVLDGESVGDVLYVFDALEANGSDITGLPYTKRYDHARAIVASIASDAIRIVPLASSASEKNDLFKSVKTRNGEGVVFKDKSAPYTKGRPASGGTQRKFKFVESASCIVEKVNEGKRSVAMVLLDTGASEIGVGNVTIPPNFTIPKAGEVIEVRYLYANAGGSLYQPVYLGVRHDIEREACVVSQLKFAAS